jgi:hypothetical protein
MYELFIEGSTKVETCIIGKLVQKEHLNSIIGYSIML